MKISNEVKLDYDDVLLVPQRSTLNSRSEVELTREFKFYHSPRVFIGTPIISSNMSCISGFQLAESLQKYRMITCLHKYINYDDLYTKYANNLLNRDFVWPSIGLSDIDLNKVLDLCNKIGQEVNLCIDVANGYMEKFVHFCKRVRSHLPNSILLGGNVCTPEMVQELIINGGLDIVKIQIGPGLGCTTRRITGIGYGSISCIDECSHAAHGLKSGIGRLGLICSDGGIKCVGDICKSFACNTDFQMLGNILGGHEENSDVCEWELDKNGNKVNMIYYGMSSHYSQNKHSEGRKSYRASEGTITKIPYKGNIFNTIEEIQGGLRSSCAYIGSTSLKDMAKCASFIRVNNIHQNYGNQKIGV